MKKSISSMFFIVLISLFFFMGFRSGLAAPRNPEYFSIRQGNRIIGFARVETDPMSDGNIRLVEKIYYPYNFFPGITQRKMIFSSDGKELVSYKQRNIFNGGDERIWIWKNDDNFSQLSDFRRFFYFRKMEHPGTMHPLEEDSPVLLFRFFKKYDFLAQSEKEKEIEYFIPSSDAVPLKGRLQGSQSGIIFNGRFKGKAVFKFGDLIKVDIPARGISYYPQSEKSFISWLSIFGNTSIPAAPSIKLESSLYNRIPATFKSHDGTIISGILTIPRSTGPHPDLFCFPVRVLIIIPAEG